MAVIDGVQAIEQGMQEQGILEGILEVISADSIELATGVNEEKQQDILEDKVLAEVPVDVEVKEEMVETKRITDNLPEDNASQIIHLQQEYMKIEAYLRKYKDYKDEAEAIISKLLEVAGEDHHWESQTQKCVYQLRDLFKTGKAHKTVTMTRYDVVHTRRKQFNEKQGSMSLTDAKNLGYNVD